MTSFIPAWFIPAVLTATVTFTFPVLIAGLGEATSERAGVYNVGMEGYMLFGAFFGFLGALEVHSIAAGFLIAMVAGMALSLVHAYCSITLKVNQIISGVALWLLGIGVTTFLNRAIFASGTRSIKSLAEVHWGAASRIPWLGQIVFRQNVLVYVGFGLVIVFAVVFHRTPFGLLNKAVGINPLAVDLAGHSVTRLRYASVLTCGAMSGLAGGYLSLAVLGSFTEEMTGGRGFIAICIVIFGRWEPKGVLLGALLFAAAEAFQARVQTAGAPVAYPFLLMIPYLLTLVVLVLAVRRGVAPAKLGVPYNKGSKD